MIRARREFFQFFDEEFLQQEAEVKIASHGYIHSRTARIVVDSRELTVNLQLARSCAVRVVDTRELAVNFQLARTQTVEYHR